MGEYFDDWFRLDEVRAAAHWRQATRASLVDNATVSFAAVRSAEKKGRNLLFS